MASYDPQYVEEKWQKIWDEKKIFTAKIDPKKPKYYVLDMFPYPSGAGLHVGHVTGYTGTDIIARYMRQKGYNVLHPIGWDSFGLPAEQYAIRTKQHPRETTEKNIQTYKKQLKRLGFSYDWEREIKTSDPSYYKWTQWFFTKLYEKGLAYEAHIHVNFCPKLGTVLANEEVHEGKSIEGGYPVERRPLRQWVLKITAYAERLLEDLESLDWPEHVKKLQRNWIGKSIGAKIYFNEVITNTPIEVFTTRADTLFGVTFLVLAPENPLVDHITTPEKEKAVQAYKEKAAQKSDLERQENTQNKTGIWTGSYAVHPLTHKKIPIWISDYVLADYGTGAVMAVPAHDERDFSFAKTFHLEIIPVINPESDNETVNDIIDEKSCLTGDGVIINSAAHDIDLNGLLKDEAIEKVISYLEKDNKGKKAVQYKLRDWLFSRQRYWGEPIPILHFEDGTKRALDLDELPLVPPDIDDYTPTGTGESPLAKLTNWTHYKDPKTDKKAIRETNTMPQWAGSCWYYLRFIDPQNNQVPFSKESENYWMPVDLYVGGLEHAVLHLLYARFWHKVFYDLGLVHTKEPFKRYQNQGLVTAKSYKKENGGYVDPEKVIEEKETFLDPETKQPLLCQVEKMSKSKLNGVLPDHVIEEYGADTLRLYEMFMGPFDKEKLWNQDAVVGCRRFLQRIFDIAHSSKLTDKEDNKAMAFAHRLVHLVCQKIEAMEFNTAIAHLMEFINSFQPLEAYPKKAVKMALQMLYPFAPHIAEECWEHLGEQESITDAPLPKVDTSLLTTSSCIYIIQVNGKFRGKLEGEKGLSKEALLSLAKQESRIAKYLDGSIEKMVFVPDKLLNVVTK
jgi:leucyl-tRNA synthetase